MDEPLVLGAILRIDAVGWAGEPPLLPTKPVRAETGEAGRTCFFYDLLPGRAGLPLPNACERIGVTLARLSDEWPFRDLPFPPRCRLDLGLSVESHGPWRLDWPAPFLAALSLEAVELGLSLYPLEAD
jgi:hypothetical protein